MSAVDSQNHFGTVNSPQPSQLNPSVQFDNKRWAVTLLSAECITGIGYRFINAGHAMIACEGVKNDKRFLRYIHLTQNPRDRKTPIPKNQAVLDVFDRPKPFVGTSNYFTLLRDKELVGRLFAYVDTKINSPFSIIPFSRFASIWNLFKTSVDSQIERTQGRETESCLTCAVFLLGKADIYLPYPKWETCNFYIQMLRSSFYVDNELSVLRILPRNPSDKEDAEGEYWRREGIDLVWGRPSLEMHLEPSILLQAADPQLHPFHSMFEEACIRLRNKTFQNINEVLGLFKDAADGGHPVAQYYMGLLSWETFEYIDTFIFDGVIDAQDLKALKGHYTDGSFSSGRDALEWFQMSADQGHIGATFAIGFLTRFEVGLLKVPYSNKWYEHYQSKGLDHPAVLVRLADQCSENFPLHILDEERVFGHATSEKMRLLQIAAYLGHPKAFYKLGRIYHHGISRPFNLDKATKWYKKALDAGELSSDAFDMHIVLLNKSISPV